MTAITKTQSGISPVLREILDWSTSQAIWRRDALRRLVVHSVVTDDDIQELTLACLNDSKALADGESAPKLEPLAASHLPRTSVADNHVRIRSISDIKYANALADGQKLSLSPDGISIVYGDNGSGKTGYARVLKHAGRARRKDDRIRSNVFADAPKKGASATIQCEVGSMVQEIHWTDGQQPDELSSVSCFDSDCAVVHVNETNSIDFTPFGLDLFSKLVSICKKVKEQIEKQLDAVIQAQLPVVANPDVHDDTNVDKFLQRLSSKTSVQQLAEVCQVNSEDEARAAQLEGILKADPNAEAKVLQQRVKRLRYLKSELDKLGRNLSDESIQAYFSIGRDAVVKRAAAVLFAKELAGITPLTGVGSNPWIELWNTARLYSEQVYPVHDFPNVGDDAVCVLCQQTLGEEAKQRLRSFDDFVKDESEKSAMKAEQQFAASRSTLERLQIGNDHWQTVISELLDDAPNVKQELTDELETARQLRQQLLDVEDFKSTVPAGWVCSSASKIAGLTESAEKKSEELLKSVNREEREALQDELSDIHDRQWLHEHLHDFVDEINRLAELDRLKKAVKTTSHTGITAKGGQLATTYVTDELTARFTREVRRLCGRDIKVVLEKGRSHYGIPTYQITLDSKQSAKPHQVLSEGEFHCIAIAGFLTELTICDNKSAIVLDDPVCSLGHEWRSEIAQRLVEEADIRQVIVFSHDMFFVEELKRFARDEQTSVHTCHVARSATEIGLCKPDLPWFGSRTLDRIAVMRDLLKERRLGYEKATWEKKIELSENFFGDVRGTIERAVEREFLDGCVKRFESYIAVKNLWKASAFDDSDADNLHKLFRKCSPRIKGHDNATSGRPSPPKIDDMLAILDDLEALIKSVHKKRNKLEDRRLKAKPKVKGADFKPSF